MKRTTLYVQLKVLGALENTPGQTMKARYRAVSEMFFTDEYGSPHRFTWRTIQTWWYWYRQRGLVTPSPRSDKGVPRKIDLGAVREAIAAVMPAFRNAGQVNLEAVYRGCIEKGLLRREQIAPNTFRRYVREFDLLKDYDEMVDGPAKKARLAFAKAHANELWQVDTLHGPALHLEGGKTKVYLICFIDDASRVVPHGQFYTRDSTENLLDCFRSALFKRGVPRAVYADNGSNYGSKEFAVTCARVGALLSHAPVRDGAAKGKIERFFRTVREQFLLRDLGEAKSISDLNRLFLNWVEDDYHQSQHSGLGMKPVDRLALDAGRIEYLSPTPYSEEIFYLEDTRVVLADNTFSFGGARYEAPRDLRSRKIEIRYNRLDKAQSRVIVYQGNDRLGEAWPVDFTGNDRPARQKKV